MRDGLGTRFRSALASWTAVDSASPWSLRRRSLWAALIALVIAVLVTLVWLAGRYEASQVQAELERDTADAVSDLRSSLSRHVQAVQALQSEPYGLSTWLPEALALLRQNRDWLRVEWRDPRWQLLAHADSPLRAPPFERTARQDVINDALQACQRAQRFNGPAYSSTYYLPQSDGLGMEVMELCLPQVQLGQLVGFTVVTYSLQELLAERLGPSFGRRNELSFIEPDGTRLAISGAHRRGLRVFTTQQLVDLPGTTLVLRMDGRRGEPDLFPNVLTALVTGMSIALITVMVLLVKDSRRRLKAERDLAEALAFRKAMEDSLVTGLRARDQQGRITYVNPAFCQMVGWEAEDLLGRNAPMPYWPPEMVDEYQQRQAIRLAGNAPPREGFESVFMRQDGTRFPVLIIEAPLISVRGEQTGWMGAVIDISEQRRVEELSRASQERLQATARLATVGEMASLLSHELNQPLAAIASYANGSLNLLRDPGAQPQTLEDVHMALRRIAEQAGRAGRVINSVHDFVRRRDQAREAVAPQALLDAIAPLVNLQARKLQVRVLTRVEPKLPSVWCDRTMVEQVLLNLARNGMQAMDRPECRDRVLVLQAKRAASNAEHSWVEFAVTDVGTGIEADVAEQLFTPFFTTKAEGMGLGLSLCRTVVEQHGGHLDYEAQDPKGTVFRFTLPATRVGPEA
ncbi:PAS domain-containing sensor histidine kinase [Limnohabitans sp. T6-5]|uniref:sensor histidine kinase n=1 Tax=Limnohabitans sp. T6-5 TaxID=1100724 RepID=UPI000D3B206C|nr:PAS domain S-box protein [Limnohabitans sp. T6-5]PUE06071.1 PAS domain-containing sensor histidine kinase [Limnohabitans sp. T6-5]